MIIKDKTFMLVTLTILILSLTFNSKVYSQQPKLLLRGDQVYEYFQLQHITPQKAYDEVVKLESDLNNTFIVINKPEVLMELAKYKIYLGYYSKEVNYVKKHLDEYTFFEPAAAYYYKGGDLKTIMDKYPGSKLADKAAFMLATMPQKAECEGDVYCYISVKLQQFKFFMEQYPHSPFQVEVIKDINQAIKPLTKGDCLNMVAGLTDKEKADYLKLLDEYNLMLLEINNKEKPVALEYLALAYNNFSQKDSVKKVLDDLSKNYPDYQRSKDLHDLITPEEPRKPAKG